MLDSFQATKSDGTELVLYVAEDDPELEAYKSLLSNYDLMIGPRVNAAGVCNEAIKSRRANFYMCINDDFVFRTHGWDKLLSEAAGAFGFSNANDLIHAGTSNIPSICCIGGGIVHALGYMIHPSLPNLLSDVSWGDLGRAIGHLVYLPHVVIEHMHYLVGKAPKDATYSVTYDGVDTQKNKELHEFWIREELPKAKDLILEACRSSSVIR